MESITTINESAAIEITITEIVKPFGLISIKLIIINLLTKKPLSCFVIHFTKALNPTCIPGCKIRYYRRSHTVTDAAKRLRLRT